MYFDAYTVVYRVMTKADGEHHGTREMERERVLREREREVQGKR